MTVLFYGSVIDHAGEQQSFRLQGSETVRDLIDALGHHFGQKFKAFLLGDETCLFLINGKGIMTARGLDTKLEPEDKVEILPFIDAG
ncbi:MAG: MoaD/ThiS family protein [Oscillospiraceae bacterium]|nr:MoaD/ThiS family protein [Oscillospiraceae bacterium]